MRKIYRISLTTFASTSSYIGKNLADMVDESYLVKETDKTYLITHHNLPATQLKPYQMHRLAKDRYHWFDSAAAADDFLREKAHRLIALLGERQDKVRKLLGEPVAASTGFDWISCRDQTPDNAPGKWSAPVAAVSNLGDVFQLSCMDGYWQRTTAFVESGATEIVEWLPLGHRLIN